MQADPAPPPDPTRRAGGTSGGPSDAAEAGTCTTDDRLFRKVARRVVWYLFVLYIFSYLDRINIAFAALAMNRELGLTPTTFGIANTVFYAGYMAFEIPSNLILARVGARRWLARIMITWGLASTATMFAVGPQSLYAIRLIVGIAEAGFLPGVLLYLTYWFPAVYRARANGFFMVAQPVTIAVGSLVSGYILQMDGLAGLSGWRWLFLLEGLPSVALGIATLFVLRDRPRDAPWLTPAETDAIEARLAGEQPVKAGPGRASAWRELGKPEVVMLSLAYFGLVSTLNTTATWVPQIIREILQSGDFVTIGLLNAVPALLTVVAMPWWSARSDRRQERLWHVTVPILCAAGGWLLVVGSAGTAFRFAGIAVVTIGAFSAMSVFWTLPAGVLSLQARPAGIALISTTGILGSAVSPTIIGFLRDETGSFSAGLLYMVALLLVSVTCVWAALWKRTPVASVR